MGKIANEQTFRSLDKRRVATYEPAQAPGIIPAGYEHYRGAIYRLVRTVRTRRGFGTIVHTLTTFTSTKAQAHKSAALWVKIKTKVR